MTRNKLLLALVAVAAAAAPARADCAGRPIEAIVAACDAAFDSDSLLTLSARGWCYIINGARCAL